MIRKELFVDIYDQLPNYKGNKKEKKDSTINIDNWINKDNPKNNNKKSIQKIARENDLKKIRNDNNINSSENNKDKYYNQQQMQYYRYCNQCKLKGDKPLI